LDIQDRYATFRGEREDYIVIDSIVTEVQKVQNEVFDVFQIYPNPFNNEIQIVYGLKAPAEIAVSVFDVFGKEIIRLPVSVRGIGLHKFNWNGKAQRGTLLPTGVYLIRITGKNNSGIFAGTKMVLKAGN